jgi:DNA-binding transcriptional regulator YhcF (GntR family)
MLPFRFQTADNGMPVSEQLVLAVRRAVIAGELKSGEIFPSVRTLAQELRISPTTAHKAVLELKEAGLLASRPGVGMVVVKPAVSTRAVLLDHLRPACESLLKEAERMGLTPADAVEALRRFSKEGPQKP